MKHLFKFTINKKEVIDVSTESVNEAGEKIITTKKEEKLVPHKFVIKRPNRVLMDEGKLYHGVKFAEAIKAGLLPISLLSKRFANDKGVLSDGEKEKYAGLYVTLYDKKSNLEVLAAKSDKTEEDKKQEQSLKLEITNIYREIQEMESEQKNLYNNTAEVYARDKTSIWWVINMSYKENDKGEWSPIYGSDSDKIEKRIEILDGVAEDGNEFEKKVMESFMFLIGYWFTAPNVPSEKDFEDAFKLLEAI